nr:sialin-1 [Pleurobrachia bachei]
MHNLPVSKSGWIRYPVVFILSYGFLLDYLYRVNVSVALEGGMVPDNCTQNQSRCWNEIEQGYVLSSFYWGYTISQLPAALFLSKLSATAIFGLGLTLSTVLTLIQPLLTGFWANLICRVIVGMGEGATFPLALTIISNWSPAQERGVFTAMATGGRYIGGVMGNILSGVLTSSNFLGGWPSVFYVYGAMGVIWSVLWFSIVRDSPQKSLLTSEGEKEYLAVSTVPQRKFEFSEVPFRRILTSRPAISTFLLHFCNGYGFFMLLTDLPKFLKQVQGFDVESSAAVAAIPYISIWLGFIFSGFVSDRLINSGKVSLTNVRKICAMFAEFLPAFLLFSSTLFNKNLPVLLLMNVSMFFQGFANSAYYVNYMDLSPRFSGVLCAIGNSAGSAAGLIGPVVVGWLLKGVEGHDELQRKWQLAFASASIVWLVGSLQFVCLGSGEKQSWDEVVEGDDDDDDDDDDEDPVDI